MLATATTSNTSFVSTYDRSGRTLSLLRSEPVERIAAPSGQDNITAENYRDKITLSESSIEKSRQTGNTDPEENSSAGTSETEAAQQKTAARQPSANVQELTSAEEKMVQQLQERDREVKTHEMAHLANAGQYARGGPTYSYQQGPDGRRYAMGGEVPIDISKEKTPEQTIQKMQAVKRAAMAPAEPSSADRSIAAAAAALESQARQEVQAAQTATPREQPETGNESQAADEEPMENQATANNAARRTQPLNIVA